MTPEEFVSGISSIILLALILYVAYGPWQRAATDLLRQRLFELRDQIFDMAADGRGFTFASDEYKEIRDTFNGLIRHAHKFTIPWYIHMYRATKNIEAHSRFTAALERIEDHKVRREIQNKMNTAASAIAAAAILRSMIALPLLLLLAPLFVILPELFKRRRRKIIRAVRHESLIDLEAEMASQRAG